MTFDLTPGQTFLRAVNSYRATLGLPVLTTAQRSLLIYAAQHPEAVQLPEPPPPPTPPPTTIVVGLNGANWGGNSIADIAGCVPSARVDDALGANVLKQYVASELKVCLLFSGPYNSNGVSGLNSTQWAANALDFYKTNTNPTQTPWIEVLNEVYGSWFWGSNANSQVNADAYARVLKETWIAFHNEYGSNAPKVIASYSDSWFGMVIRNTVGIDVSQYYDGAAPHPYGGTDDRASSALGDRNTVTQAHLLTQKPVYITEVGWPTAVGQSSTGDSLQWSEADQAVNIVNFVTWAKSTGYVRAVWIFAHHDYDTNAWYGVVRSDGSHKPSYAALKSVVS